MEYGNLSIDNISNQNVDVSMADGVSLADEADPLDVYTIHRATAVSYTHLDVYKRQGHTYSWCCYKTIQI